MNTPVKKQFALFALAALGFIGSANAQRGHGGGGSRDFGGNNGGGRSGGFAQTPSANRQNNFSFNNQSRHEAFGRQTTPVSPARPSQNFGNRDAVSLRRLDNNNTFTSRPSQRFDNNVAASRPTDRRLDQPSVNNTFNRPQTQRNVTVVNNNRIVNNFGYGSRYNYTPRRYGYVGAPRYSVLPHGYSSIRFGGYPYYYHSGLFYSYYDGFYQPVFAPIGIRISILPVGYYPFYIGPRRYYYYDGIYYRNYNNSTDEYEVVDAPEGAQVSTLPKGASVATVNGEKFYEFNGTYYKEGTNSKNEVIYTVVGKYGHVNNTEAGVSDLQQPALRVGDVIPVLPDGCKEVTINGEQLYVSPDNTYFKAQTYDGNTSYKIVGMGSAKQ